MDERTREYLAGRFGDYYRNGRVTPPPGAQDREWGYIPFTVGEGTTMVRHQSLLDEGISPDELDAFLARESPQHVYFSAATYDDPGNRSMDEKGWRGADLVFDLDADHLPGVDPEVSSYREMLNDCKEALEDLVDLLEQDLGFRQTEIVFSGGRGYHVHVRDEGVRELDSDARREIVDYVRGIDLNKDGLISTESNEIGVPQRRIRAEGGWGRRVHNELVKYAQEILGMEKEEAMSELQKLDNVGRSTANQIYNSITKNPDGIRNGNVEVGRGTKTLIRALTDDVLENDMAPVDEPVTTDVRRLIRLPESLHGGTGFVVRRLAADELPSFEPWRDAVADQFRGRRIMIEVTDPGPVPFASSEGDDSFTIEGGSQSVREFVGVFLLSRGRARKLPE